MVSLDIRLTLPDDLAREAEARGLLAPQALERLISTELDRQRRIDDLFETMDGLAALDIPPLTNEELNAEIAAARAERRARNARGS